MRGLKLGREMPQRKDKRTPILRENTSHRRDEAPERGEKTPLK